MARISYQNSTEVGNDGYEDGCQDSMETETRISPKNMISHYCNYFAITANFFYINLFQTSWNQMWL